ncbi:MAG: hypothetical protein JWL97_3729 [Gemmatimonadales bacterium]|jgi:hypothetical protein|nr:hypothetical protein [Gemmatimonadales bacterium]
MMPAADHDDAPAAVGTEPSGQAQALRAVADLLDRHALPDGLSVTVNERSTVIQITPRSADDPARFRACKALAAAIGGVVGHQADTAGPTCGWLTADGHWAGHRVHVFTPIDAAPDAAVGQAGQAEQAAEL